jgi:hypothetical protein
MLLLLSAWITGMDLATSSGLLLTTSEDGYVRQGEVILSIIYISLCLLGLVRLLNLDDLLV